MANFDLTNLAVKMICPTNAVLLDNAGLPSIMVYIPKFKISDVIDGGSSATHPAFIVNGQEVPGFYFSKYQNIMQDGLAYSMPGEDPANSLNFDTARQYCEAKGAGWHLPTFAEWAAIALWCKKNGTMPKGNNNYGKDTTETNYKAVPTYVYNDAGVMRVGRVATGTGPLTWSHDGTLEGIWDLNGNVWEWLGGYRVVNGQPQFLANNDAADSDNPQTVSSQLWKAIDATTGLLVDPTAPGTVKLDYVSGKWTYCTTITSQEDSSRACSFKDVTCTADVKQPAQDVLRALAMLPVAGDTNYGDDYFYANNGAAERLAYRGGGWNGGANAGVFSVNGNNPRSSVSTYVGFRSAFIPGI